MQSQFLKSIGVEHQKYPLSGLDLVFGFHYVNTVCFLDKDYDISALEPAMQETINRIPVLAGKIIKENGQLVLDTDGAGVQFSYEVADQPAPEHDERIFPLSGYDFFNPIPQAFNVDISELPLLSIKITTFSDGIKCIGISHNHAIMDGASTYAFLCAWTGYMEGVESKPLIFSRDTVTQLADNTARLPSRTSGIAVVNDQVVLAPPTFFQNPFHTIDINDEYRHLGELIKARSKHAVSINHLIAALIFKAYGLSSAEDDVRLARLNQSYDIRIIKGAELPANFFGNAVLFRCLEMPFGELRSLSILSLVNKIKEAAQSVLENTPQDIGFYQSQYEQGAYNKAGVFTGFPTIMGNGGLYLNNLVHFLSESEWPGFFGRKQIRGDIVLPQLFGVRTAIVSPNRKSGVLLRLALENYQAPAFEKAWSQLVSEVLSKNFSAQ